MTTNNKGGTFHTFGSTITRLYDGLNKHVPTVNLKVLVLLIIASFIFFYVSFDQISLLIVVPQTPVRRIPRIPPDPPIDWNWMGYLNHVNQPDYTLTYKMTSGGFSVRFRCLLCVFWHALYFNRTFILDYTDQEYERGGSSYGNWTDFFLPIHSAEYFPQKVPPTATIFHKSGSFNQPHVFGYDFFCPGECLPSNNKNIMHQASLMLWRFNENARAEIEDMLSIFPDWSSRRYHAIHIRRGDKIWGPFKEGVYIDTEAYCKTLERLVGGNVTDPVFVASDTQQSIPEVKRLRPNWELWYIQAEDLRGGNYSTMEFVKRSREYRLASAKLLFAEFTMMKYAHYFVGQTTSNISSFISILRGEQRPPIGAADSPPKKRDSRRW